MLQGLHSHCVSLDIRHPVGNCRLYLIDLRSNAKKYGTSSLERLYDCLPIFRVPLQPSRYGVSVQDGGAIVGSSFAKLMSRLEGWR
jgi:hypothetical protein